MSGESLLLEAICVSPSIPEPNVTAFCPVTFLNNDELALFSSPKHSSNELSSFIVVNNNTL